MGSLLMYRGLPGGPTEIKLADEIPRHCLCGRCGMLTLSMYQDPKDHMFCEICLKEQSTEGRSSIYCPYERKDVGIEEMFQARDLVMILRDQYVDCPNQPDCTAKLPLENLHDHYVTCKPRVQCSRCNESIETKQWKNHNCTSVIQGSVPNTKERTGASKKTFKDGGHQENEEPSVFSSQEPRECKQSLMEKVRRALAASTAPHRGWTTEASRPDRQAASAKRGTSAPMQDNGSENCGPAATQECEYCHRKVKETNMQRHVQNCTRAPRPCVYCDEPFLPEDMKSSTQKVKRSENTTKRKGKQRTTTTGKDQSEDNDAEEDFDSEAGKEDDYDEAVPYAEKM
ncbi:hypothetical protein HPB50_025129 [Hyalomma asiaticum]|uniref:Uncharacterized protein n=1 Tax=Hyalomma asiaticum TaxID=266040 RepID=A0ACB7RTL8_HYAAI|nr:hypothetical protein HPB50_025129 [Hyalomma asiaticum]